MIVPAWTGRTPGSCKGACWESFTGVPTFMLCTCAGKEVGGHTKNAHIQLRKIDKKDTGGGLLYCYAAMLLCFYAAMLARTRVVHLLCCYATLQAPCYATLQTHDTLQASTICNSTPAAALEQVSLGVQSDHGFLALGCVHAHCLCTCVHPTSVCACTPER